MEAIYRADNPEALLEIFKKQYRTIVYSPELYKSVFSNVVSRNDSVDMQELGHKRDLSEEDRIRLAIRMLARCILRMGDIDRDGERLLEMAQMLFTLPEPAQGWHNQYFYTPLYNALAKNCPKKLKAMSRRPPPQFQVDSGEAALALLRNGHPVGQEVIRSILRRNPRENGYMPLLYYLRDSGFKLGYLGKKWEEDKDSIYSRREIINALASFPEGETRLLEMKEEGAIRWEKSSGICFGTLSRSVTEDDLKSEGAMQAMSQAGGYIMKANQRFGGAERILYVDITSDEDAEGHALNIAGWGQNSLYMTRSAFLGRSARCVAFMLAHEACEQRSVQGYLTAELGLSYLKAVSNPRRNDGALEDLRLGARVGGNYVDTGLGHPWDSEREWLAESASAVIIGEPVPQRARDAIASAIATFRNP